VRDGGALVLLDTDVPTRAELSWDGGRPRRASDDALATHHELRMSGLRAGRACSYRVTVRDERGSPPVVEEARFHTAPSAAHPFRFVLMGDVRSGHDVHAQLVRAVTAEDPDLVLMTGDLVETGSEEGEWQRYFDIEEPLLRQVPVYSAVGNHDAWRRGEGLRRFLELFPRTPPLAWSSFDVSGIHFVLLDSGSYKDPQQLAWLQADLAEARAHKPRAIFVCAHHGPWSSAVHGDNAVAIRDYVPLLESARVTAFLSGHDHDYERGKVGGLLYLVSGGGGAELRTPRCGVPGKRRCPPRMRAFVNDHHYVSIEVLRDQMRVCPKRPDGTLLEPCPTLPLRR
jgi:hypothetical protein